MMKKSVCVVGLGFVGLPMADLCSRKGYLTYGLDVDKNKLDSINKGINPFSGEKIKNKIIVTNNYNIIKKCDIIVICVPTPIGEDRQPDLSILEAVSKALSSQIKKNQLVILESTVNPGVTEGILIKNLEKNNLKAGKDFYVSHCPERIDIGNKKWTIETLPRVIGACSEEGLKRATSFYKSILKSDLKTMSSIKSAEAVKVFENTFRDINIALVNDLAKAFDKIGLDFIEIIQGAATKPFGFMPFYPGPGIGGTCIPMSATYLKDWIEKEGLKTEMISVARKINDSMPEYVVRKTIEAINSSNLYLHKITIGILGLSYKGGVPDTRDSPSYLVIKYLKEKNIHLEIFDPFVLNESTVKTSEEFLEKCECIILLTDHPEFKNYNFKNTKILIDSRNFLNKDMINNFEFKYYGLGRN